MMSDAGRPTPTQTIRSNRSRWIVWLLPLALLLAGCRTPALHPDPRPFVFEADTFCFGNELVWDYQFDPEAGMIRHSRRTSRPDYTLRCFVLARSAAQFHRHARFEPGEPRASEEVYRTRVRSIVRKTLRREPPPGPKITIPGYHDLRGFSRDFETLLKEECGGAWQSYWQRGHWRMVLPLSRAHQERMAGQLVDQIRTKGLAVVHTVRFPSLSINHALILFAAEENANGIGFLVYDPNAPEEPARLNYDRARRRFIVPRNGYFAGGRVDLYQIYHSWNY